MLPSKPLLSLILATGPMTYPPLPSIKPIIEKKVDPELEALKAQVFSDFINSVSTIENLIKIAKENNKVGKQNQRANGADDQNR